jgi:hypothetical protein
MLVDNWEASTRVTCEGSENLSSLGAKFLVSAAASSTLRKDASKVKASLKQTTDPCVA